MNDVVNFNYEFCWTNMTENVSNLLSSHRALYIFNWMRNNEKYRYEITKVILFHHSSCGNKKKKHYIQIRKNTFLINNFFIWRGISINYSTYFIFVLLYWSPLWFFIDWLIIYINEKLQQNIILNKEFSKIYIKKYIKFL